MRNSSVCGLSEVTIVQISGNDTTTTIVQAKRLNRALDRAECFIAQLSVGRP